MNKEEAEIENIQNETKNSRIRLYHDLIKSALIICGTIFFFFIIQKPDSILNKKSSIETINRERAKLVLELINKKDSEDILLGLDIIEESYPTNDKWIEGIRKIFQIRRSKELFDSMSREKLDKPRLSALKQLNYWYGAKEEILRNKIFSNHTTWSAAVAEIDTSKRYENINWGLFSFERNESVIDENIVSEKRGIIEYLDSIGFKRFPNPEHEEH
ncbi:hypothetical protein [uncultured Aquimarina sp.]|uniref:hypothetical protein n=1 Tax=uncultured Aquimarina sp. TaxID=575652 RepID=UPI00262DBDD1|nr:hypothetical protein [uncultured Aquimarina sp.]